jgi:hypothetical protein
MRKTSKDMLLRGNIFHAAITAANHVVVVSGPVFFFVVDGK